VVQRYQYIISKWFVHWRGYDDILIGASLNDQAGASAGKAYVIFGKNSWVKNESLVSPDASFIGEYAFDRAGSSVRGVGDVNGDGKDDILIGAMGNDEGGNNAGQVYLFLGKSAGWSPNTTISSADASFIGENKTDKVGESPSSSISCDVNGDGFDDIIIDAHCNCKGGEQAGQAYLLFLKINDHPQSINSVKIYSDNSYSDEINFADINDTCYIELIGTDSNSSQIDRAIVNITSTGSTLGIRLKLVESGADTGKYHGKFTITNKTYGRAELIKASYGDTIVVTSVNDSTKNANLVVDVPVQLRPFKDNTVAFEDEEYYEKYWSFGFNQVSTWTFESMADWLNWNPNEHTISGTPNNGDVGSFPVRIYITDGLDNYDEHFFNIDVYNTPPTITYQKIPSAIEDKPYYFDLNSTDDHQGIIIWYIDTNATWLDFDPLTGELSGTPTNDDKGSYWVNVSVHEMTIQRSLPKMFLPLPKMNPIQLTTMPLILMAKQISNGF
jgi:hypothetical protein